jgi:hypothetical protein
MSFGDQQCIIYSVYLLTMKQIKLIFPIAMLLLTASPANPGLTIQPQSLSQAQPSPWNGTWQDNAGTVMTIREHNGFLDILGKDQVSIYNAVCLINSDTNEAECIGEGMNHNGDFRFLYRSTLSLEPSGEINETWKASFSGGERSGEGIFQKINMTRTR